jgi:hypothetical protein
MININQPKHRPPRPSPSKFSVKAPRTAKIKRCYDWELKREIDRINREYQDYDYD